MGAEPFKFRRDFRRVQWLPTLQVNLLRSVAAGVVVGMVVFVGSFFSAHGKVQWQGLTFPFLWPLMYLVFLLPIGILCAFLAGVLDNIVGTIAAFIALVMALYQTVGDPLVFILHRKKPAWVPLDRYPFFAFTLILWVLKPEADAAPVRAPRARAVEEAPPEQFSTAGEEEAMVELSKQKAAESARIHEFVKSVEPMMRGEHLPRTPDDFERLERVRAMVPRMTALMAEANGLMDRATKSRTARLAAQAKTDETKPSGKSTTPESRKAIAQAKYNAGVALFDTEDTEQKRAALLCFAEAVELDPDCLDAHVALGRAFLVMHDPKSAMRHADQAVRIAPQDSRAQNLLVVAHMGLGDEAYEREDWPSAYEHYKRALLAGPTDANAVNIVGLLGVVWQRCDMGDDFIALCHDLLERNPSDNHLRFKLGNALLKCGRHAEALPVCIEYKRRDQACVKGWWQVGIAYVANGNVEAAEAEYERLVEHDAELAADLRTFID